MINECFEVLSAIEDHLWGYLGFPMILILGGILTWVSRGMQLRSFPAILREFYSYLTAKEKTSAQGLGPLRAFFTSIGGCLGIGNVVAIAAAVQIGGPGSLLWIWLTSILGCLVKYAEVYIAIKHKRVLRDGSFKGGPMYFLQDAFGSKIPGLLFCVLLSLYGVEIYQFSVVASVSADALGCSKVWTVLVLLSLVLLAAKGGLQRVSKVASLLVPFIITFYLIMGVWVLMHHASIFPSLFLDVFRSAFTPRAAEGGFIGSSLLLTISQGVRRGCYSSDIGIGYASIIHSETNNPSPVKQARLLIFEVFTDTFIVCTLSALVVLVTGVWKTSVDSSKLVQVALSSCFPYMEYFMPLLICLLGFSTVMTYLSAGMRTAAFLSPNRGTRVYALYATLAFLFFSFHDTDHARCMMSLIGLFLLTVNSLGIWKLRKEIVFDEETEYSVSSGVEGVPAA